MKRGSGFYRFRGFKGFKGEGGGFAATLDDAILVSQPSRKGRIGQGRYERQMRKAEKCAAYVGEARVPDRE